MVVLSMRNWIFQVLFQISVKRIRYYIFFGKLTSMFYSTI